MSPKRSFERAISHYDVIVVVMIKKKQKKKQYVLGMYHTCTTHAAHFLVPPYIIVLKHDIRSIFHG